MSLLLILATGWMLCASSDAKQDNDPTLAIQETQGQMNLLWLAILYPRMYEHLHKGNWSYATCKVEPSADLQSDKPQVKGQVLFKQLHPYGKLQAIFSLDGFPQDAGLPGRAIHVHHFGDLSKGCDSTGGHYNPFQVPHPSHPGDFGNFFPKDGKIRTLLTNLQATLFGAQAILGRSVVVHEGEDDMGKGNNTGSLLHGNAGKRLACCVIGYCTDELWGKAYAELLKT